MNNPRSAEKNALTGTKKGGRRDFFFEKRLENEKNLLALSSESRIIAPQLPIH
ncbi:MAG: hypothetical protein JNJ94_11935 [Chlorobi bacterium]|nr:hypothetical protein [Chlorobiota bacterium]